jgi:transglycosylase-like protein with SLT domain
MVRSRRNRKWKVYLAIAGAVAGAFAVNWIVQVARKPTELFFPVSGVLNKTPAETWREYAPIFRAHSTAVMTPELLAALAQVEGAGNPVAQTYWRWRLTQQPFEVYRPASSAVGMYQITDATYAQARRLCIHHHAVSEDCWFNFLYLRTVPSHAVEMTAAFLDRAVERRMKNGTLQQKQELAALVHLCGENVRLGARRCGEHDAQAYLAQVNAMKRVFTRLSSGKPEWSW